MRSWKVFSTVPTPWGQMEPKRTSPTAALDIFDCPACGALVPRDRIPVHERWHKSLERV